MEFKVGNAPDEIKLKWGNDYLNQPVFVLYVLEGKWFNLGLNSFQYIYGQLKKNVQGVPMKSFAQGVCPRQKGTKSLKSFAIIV